jgi:type II secretory pathway component GspD/PulD (secretin)
VVLPGNGRYRLSLAGCACLVTALLLIALPAVGQVFSATPGQPMSREQAEAMMKAQREARSHGNNQPPQPDKPKGDEKKEKKDEGDKDKKDEATSIKRPEKPPRVPDPREFEVTLDDNDRVPPFNFIGQPWPDVLQWLATVSKCSLDWQELPSDYLNLTTQRSYTLAEVRDLINRHLHARGYTMVQGGEVLSVFKIEKLDPSLVRRVSEDELYDLKPYDFVKVSFVLPEGMAPDKGAEDVKKILSPHAKVFPLVTTKRLLVIDAVANLRLVSSLLNEERAEQDGRMIPREFVLKYARAEQVIDILYVVLGLDPKSRPTQMELQLQQKRMELMTQMQQRGTDVSKMLKKDGGPPVYLAFNRQLNSVLVNAPPEQMRVIERTIHALDVPAGGAPALETAGQAAGREFKKYQMVSLDPERMLLTLEEIGGLSPWTEMRADAKSKTLFVRASEADHAKIAGLIDQLDGTGRQFEVIYLRRLPADAVAATIFNLMVGQEEEEEENEMPWYWGRNRRQEKEEKPNKGFRVDADIENNRLLLWVNDAELKEVRRLLAKLGELPGEQSDPRTVRFIEPTSDAARERLLDQFRSAWSATGSNELIINQPPKSEPTPTEEKKPAAETSAEPASDQSARTRQRAPFAVEFAQLGVPAPEPDSDNPSAAAPPVTVTVTEDGRLMLSSPDTKALDRAEDLLGQLSPPAKRFKLFRLKHISAYNMWLNLDEYFYDELHGQDQSFVWDWWGRRVNTGSKDTSSGLSKRRSMQIIYDTPSQTILVANASPSQLYEVQQLIDEYDRPAPADSIKARRTAVVKIRYSRAAVIAAAVKDVYRDLLSSRDKEFQSGDKKDQGSNRESVTVIRYGGSEAGGDDNKRGAPAKVGFDGALSIGVDEIANMLVISAQEEIFDGVVAMVQRLDEEAAPKTTVHVHRVSREIDAAALQKALSEAVGKPWPGGRPEKEPAAAAGQGKKPEGDGDKNEGRDNGRD